MFNGLTASRQRVGNWPGKTVELKEGFFDIGDEKYQVIDLPGSYSLSANSQEEIVTRDYIVSGKADLVCVLADASQIERSLFMLAEFSGINVPALLLLNLLDVENETAFAKRWKWFVSKLIEKVKLNETNVVHIVRGKENGSETKM